MKLKRLVSYSLVSLIVISLIFPPYGFCAHKQPKNLNKRLAKLEDKLIANTLETEEVIRKSGALYEDEETIEYINSVAKKIIPADFNDEKIKIDVRIIRDPTVNAFALPTGTVFVHTGLLARLRSEAQLAFLLGHELSHIINKDGVYKTDSMHNKTVSTKLFDLVLSPAAVFFGLLGSLAQSGFNLLYIASVTGYSKEQEATADRESIKFASRANYDPKEAPRIIEILMKEHDKYSGKSEIYFLMSHPSNKYRKKKMLKLIDKEYADFDKGETGRDVFFKKAAKVKILNAVLNIKTDRLLHAMDDVEAMLDVLPEDVDAHFYTAWIYREMAEDIKKLKDELSPKEWDKIKKKKKQDTEKQIEDWRSKALEEYQFVLLKQPDYHDAYRGLGILYNDMGRRQEALSNLSKYLELKSDARDRRYVKSLISDIEGKISDED